MTTFLNIYYILESDNSQERSQKIYNLPSNHYLQKPIELRKGLIPIHRDKTFPQSLYVITPEPHSSEPRRP